MEGQELQSAADDKWQIPTSLTSAMPSESGVCRCQICMADRPTKLKRFARYQRCELWNGLRNKCRNPFGSGATYARRLSCGPFQRRTIAWAWFLRTEGRGLIPTQPDPRYFRATAVIDSMAPANAEIGDIVIYRDADGNVSHVGVVAEKKGAIITSEAENCSVQVLSKWGFEGEYLHDASHVPTLLGTPAEYWTHRRKPLRP